MAKPTRGQGSVRFRDGRWEARLQIGGKRHTCSFDKDADAWSWIATLKADAIRGVLRIEEEEKECLVTFDDLARAYKIRRMPGWRAGTLAYFKCHVEDFLVPRFTGRLITSITSQELQALLDDKRVKPREWRGQRKDPVKASTVNKLHQQLSALFRFAVRQGWLPESPMVRVDRAKERKDDEFQPRALRLHELQAFLRACRPADRLFFIILVLTGLRRGEIFRMTWDWVDLENKILHVKIGKTGSDDLPMADAVRDTFLELGPQPDGLVFFGSPLDHVPNPTKALSNKRKAILGACKRAGIDPTGITMHTFRRTFVTLLEESGIPYGTVRKLARHGMRPSDITARYLLPTQDQLRKAVEALASRVLGPASIIPLHRQQPPVSLAR